jgi:hypothetical protein
VDADRDREVAVLQADGYSYRAIAKMLGMSLAGVQRALRRAETPPRLDDLSHDDEPPIPFDSVGEDPVPVGSVRFAGVDEFDERVEVFADARGGRFNLLDLYRHTPVDGGALLRDAIAQLAAGRP